MRSIAALIQRQFALITMLRPAKGPFNPPPADALWVDGDGAFVTDGDGTPIKG